MGWNEVLQAVTTVGFPIVCSGAMMWYVKYITDKNREEVTNMSTLHKEEISEVTQALNNNTLVLQKLCDILDAGDAK